MTTRHVEETFTAGNTALNCEPSLATVNTLQHSSHNIKPCLASVHSETTQAGVSEYGLMSHRTQYRSFRRRGQTRKHSKNSNRRLFYLEVLKHDQPRSIRKAKSSAQTDHKYYKLNKYKKHSGSHQSSMCRRYYGDCN